MTKDALNALLSLDNLDQNELRALRKKYTALGQSEVKAPVKDRAVRLSESLS